MNGSAPVIFSLALEGSEDSRLTEVLDERASVSDLWAHLGTRCTGCLALSSGEGAVVQAGGRQALTGFPMMHEGLPATESL